MFTGIVEEVGRVASVPAPGHAGQLVVEASHVLEDARLGDSIAVNGVCLTLTRFGGGRFWVDIMPETLARSNLGALRSGAEVNLERAMQLNGRFGGHIVTGHIDGVGRLRSRNADQNAVRVRVACDAGLLAGIVQKGSIAIDGIGLTVSNLYDDGFEVSVIPHTGAETTLLRKRPGDVVNLETDVLGKYVARLLGDHAAPTPPDARYDPGGITLERLRACGF